MVFSSTFFLFLFLPVTLILYFFIHSVTKTKGSNLFLLLASLIFYYLGEPSLYLLLILSILWNYIFGILTTKSSLLFFIGIGGNLSILIYYKYIHFIIQSIGIESLFLFNTLTSEIILPIGISFFTFQGISYLIDVNKTKTIVEYNPLNLGLYISFFPQLIAGPIIKFHEINKEIKNRTITIDNCTAGSFRFIRGLAKKVVLANNFAIISDTIFQTEINDIPSPIAWLGIILYSLQIYYDFSGYSDMAIGISKIMGFNIPENFNYPYISKSIREFWRRWHISLSTWFRDYLYIPLGGNRRGNTRLYFNLLIVFFLTGLWHGASYNFICWGLIHGAFIIIERFTQSKLPYLPKILQHTYILLIIITAWVFFRISTIEDAIIYISKLYFIDLSGENYSSLLLITPYIILLFILGVIFSTPLLKKINFKTQPIIHSAFQYTFHTALILFTLSELSTNNYQSFIYFKF